MGCRLESLFALVVVIQILNFLDRVDHLVEKVQLEFKEPMDSVLITISCDCQVIAIQPYHFIVKLKATDG